MKGRAKYMNAAEHEHNVLANSSISSDQSPDGEIHKNIIETDLVDRMVAMAARSAAAAFFRLLVEPS